MACIVKKHHLKVLFKEMQFVAFFIFHMGKARMQVKNDLRCLRQIKKKFSSLLNMLFFQFKIDSGDSNFKRLDSYMY